MEQAAMNKYVIAAYCSSGSVFYLNTTLQTWLGARSSAHRNGEPAVFQDRNEAERVRMRVMRSALWPGTLDILYRIDDAPQGWGQLID